MNLLDASYAFANPGEDSLIDCINPDTGKSWINGETLEQIRERYPRAEVVNIDAWMKSKAAAQDSPIEWLATTEERYHAMLEVLPPAFSGSGGFLVGEPMDHHATSGQPRFTAFVHRGNEYFTANRPLTIQEFKSI